MSELPKIVKRRHFPARVKLSVVRDRLIKELDFTEIIHKKWIIEKNCAKKYGNPGDQFF